MGNSNIMLTVMAVILAVIGSVIVQGLVTNITTLTGVTNETVTVGSESVNGTTDTLAHFPLDGTALTLIGNGKVLGNPQNFTYATATGVISWNSTVWGNVSSAGTYYNATYQYQPNGYVTSSINRIILPFLSVFILLGSLALMAYLHFR